MIQHGTKNYPLSILSSVQSSETSLIEQTKKKDCLVECASIVYYVLFYNMKIQVLANIICFLSAASTCNLFVPRVSAFVAPSSLSRTSTSGIVNFCDRNVCRFASASNDEEEEHVDIAIVGAGIGGLCAGEKFVLIPHCKSSIKY